MKLTLLAISLSLSTLTSAGKCDNKRSNGNGGRDCSSSTVKSTSTPSTLSTPRTTSSTSSTISSSPTSVPSTSEKSEKAEKSEKSEKHEPSPTYTVVTETACYLGSAFPTTWTTTLTTQSWTTATVVTVTTSTSYGSASCFPTAVTRRVGGGAA